MRRITACGKAFLADYMHSGTCFWYGDPALCRNMAKTYQSDIPCMMQTVFEGIIPSTPESGFEEDQSRQSSLADAKEPYAGLLFSTIPCRGASLLVESTISRTCLLDWSRIFNRKV